MEGMSSKFMPKYEVKRVSGKNMIVASVRRRIVSFVLYWSVWGRIELAQRQVVEAITYVEAVANKVLRNCFEGLERRYDIFKMVVNVCMG